MRTITTMLFLLACTSLGRAQAPASLPDAPSPTKIALLDSNYTAVEQDVSQHGNIPTTSENTQPAKSDDPGLGIMDYLSKNGQHDLHNETWNVYGQLTTIGYYKPSFHAAYTDLNGSNSSLKTDAETSFTQTLTLFFGIRLRPGTALYIVPEEISETTLSNLKGLGGATENFGKCQCARPMLCPQGQCEARHRRQCRAEHHGQHRRVLPVHVFRWAYRS